MALTSDPTVAHLRHRYPPALVLRVAWALLRRESRSFAADAAHLAQTLQPPPRVDGLEHVPSASGFVTVFNHYYSRSFPSWWCAIVLTWLIQRRRAPFRPEIAWVMTEAWTYRDPLRQRLVTPASRWLFRRIARLYGFVAMPPMPPRAHEVQARARAVRQLLSLARRAGPVLIAISPEGRDSPDAGLLVPPPGVGRLLLHLAGQGFPFLPATLCEEGSRPIVRFGPAFRLQPPADLPPAQRDAWAAGQAMLAIGRLLPPALWGAYREPLAGAGDCRQQTP